MNTLSHEEFDAQEYIYESHKKRTKVTGNPGSVIRQVLSNLKIGADLTHISAPAFIMRPVSQLEWNTDVMAPNPALLKGLASNNPVQRILGVTESLLIGCSEIPQEGMARGKPYNPVIGERYACTWIHENSTTFAHCEQVSHHPPISAYHVHNPTLNWHWTSIQEPKPVFKGNSIEIALLGYNVLTTEQDEYHITLPSVHVRGLLFGTNAVECGQELIVRCPKSDLEMIIKMKDKNEVKGKLVQISNNKTILSVTGNILGRVTVEGQGIVLLDYNNRNKAVVQLRKVSEQDEMESRRVWHTVTYAIVNNDLDSTNALKNKIEEHQRQLRKQNVEVQLKWFASTGEKEKDVPLFKYVHE
jgi:hypothetical protein